MMVYTNLKRFISLEVCSASFVSCFQSTAEKRLNLSPPSCKYTELLKMMAVLTAMCILMNEEVGFKELNAEMG